MHAARVAAVAGIALTTAAFAQSLQGLGHLDPGPYAPASYATGISDDGQVVTGASNSFRPDSPTNSGPGIFRWSQSTGMQLIRSAPEVVFGNGAALSADGAYMVGYGAQSQVYIGQGFRYGPSTGFSLLGGIPGPQYTSTALDISPDGQTIVGASSTQTTQSTSRQTPYKWTQSTGMIALPGLYNVSQGWASSISADGSTIVGSSYYNNIGTIGPRAVRWTSAGVEHLGQLAGIPLYSSYATCVSHDGSVIAGYQVPDFNQPGYAYIWTAEVGIAPLTTPDIHFYVRAMNADGAILVGESSDSGSTRAMIWTESAGLEDLNSYAAAHFVDLTGWTLRTANAITPDGLKIVGEALNPSGQSEAYLLNLDTIVVDCSSDFNGDGDFGTDADVEAFFACLAGNCCQTCYAGGADFNNDGDWGTDADIEAFFRVLAGNCW